MENDNVEIIHEISNLKKERNAVIVAHNYQIDAVQEIADMVGDSFSLSQFCSKSQAEVIVFCGVHFMAESAKILSPEKTVLLPAKDAGCPMADMIEPEALSQKKKEYSDAAVVCYVNSSAAVKAESDICCSSSNAVKVVKSVPQEKVIFVPDQNLGKYVSNILPEKKIIAWEGYCTTHHGIKAEDVKKIRQVHPDAMVLVHPECKPEIAEMADFVGSTKQIIDFARESKDKKFIIGTEMGVMYSLKKENPEKNFYLLSQRLICPNMKKTSLKSIYEALKEMKYKIDVDEEIRKKAKVCLDRMLQIK